MTLSVPTGMKARSFERRYRPARVKSILMDRKNSRNGEE